MNMIAFALLAFFAVGGSVLAGGDFGAAMRIARIRGDNARRTALAGFGPLCLSHEGWLIVTAGLLTGFYAPVEEHIFSAAYPWVVGLLLGWIARNTGLWMRGRLDHGLWRWLCDTAMIGGALLFAVALGGLLATASNGPWWAVAANMVALPLLLIRHGDAYLRLRVAVAIPPLGRWPMAGVALLAIGAPGAGPLIAIATAAFAAIGLVWANRLARRGRDLAATGATGLAVVSALLPVAASAAWSGTVTETKALTVIVVVAAVILPVLLGLQATTWWLFRAPATGPSYL